VFIILYKKVLANLRNVGNTGGVGDDQSVYFRIIRRISMYPQNRIFFLADWRTLLNISKEFDLDKTLYDRPVGY